jgi:uncharacterized membrane protein
MNRSRFQFGIRSLLAVTTWCAIGFGVIKWQPEACSPAPVVAAVVCLAVAWECTRSAHTRLWARTFIVAMVVQFVGWLVFICLFRATWYPSLYFPVIAIYESAGLIPWAGLDAKQILVTEIPIAGATLFSLIVAAFAVVYARGAIPTVEASNKEDGTGHGDEEHGASTQPKLSSQD